jgi:hypothetical protein
MGAVTCLFLSAGTLHAEIFTGTLYYTNFAGGNNVDKVTFNYDSSTHSLSVGSAQVVANVNGADGIMFAPNGNLIVTSNTTNSVYRIDATNGNVLQTVNTGTPGFPDFHMALDPNGTQFYSSDRYDRVSGPLDTFKINSNGSFDNATTTSIAGGDSNVTQLAFAPNGKILYTDGTPNSNGSVGLFTFGAGADTTDQLFGANQITAAHGVVYDPYTGLWTMFGGGAVATLDPNAGSDAAIIGSLKQEHGINGDFDQGSVDGFGHALIAGNGQITFIDYSQTHDITSPLDTVIKVSGFDNIDDVAPLVGLGAPSNTPEPSSFILFGMAVTGLGAARWRKRKQRA